ncbi:MAG: carbamoyl phosphate synthase small subunit, partial [Treponema sp.]|nr:carbamoyl phosphate synthase small subunit [Treponema sp.]
APHILLWDFGAKANIKRELEKRGAKVTVLPYNTSAEKILSINPDGIMLSNGPGDPAENITIIEEIKKICEHNKISHSIPIFGICLGHQMLALARGCKTCKLKYGHRGGNHPVKDTATNRVYITSQNHGYAVENSSLPQYAKMSFFNVNDGTVEGITYTDIPAFSVQFHPEACGGPHDTNFLFDKFLEMIRCR